MSQNNNRLGKISTTDQMENGGQAGNAEQCETKIARFQCARDVIALECVCVCSCVHVCLRLRVFAQIVGGTGKQHSRWVKQLRKHTCIQAELMFASSIHSF